MEVTAVNQYDNLISRMESADVARQLGWLYGTEGSQIASQKTRYADLLRRHESHFHAESPVSLISAPGRCEVGGNHTDHNRGRVLAASVNLDTLAAVSPRSDMTVCLRSEGYPLITLSLNQLEKRDDEEGTTAALIRGVAFRMHEMGYTIGGFDAEVTSTVASGSGLSSSAAFEVLITAVFDKLYNRFEMDGITRAKIGQFAENVYFGKPSGLLDQTACAFGGLVAVDFLPDEPEVQPLSYDFAQKSYALVVVAAGGSHANLTADYAAIPAEMKEVAAFFGAPNLRLVKPADFYQAISQLRSKISDRAILRAIHFFNENVRVRHQVDTLLRDDLPAFLEDIIASGRSSYMYLQNVYASAKQENLCLALALAEGVLAGRGAWRVHGGGFAGTTLNFVPFDLLTRFVETMENAFGPSCCHVLNIRPAGAYALQI